LPQITEREAEQIISSIGKVKYHRQELRYLDKPVIRGHIQIQVDVRKPGSSFPTAHEFEARHGSTGSEELIKLVSGYFRRYHTLKLNEAIRKLNALNAQIPVEEEDMP